MLLLDFSSGSNGYRLDAAWVDDFGEILHQRNCINILITIGTTFGIQVGQVMKTNSCHHLQVQILTTNTSSIFKK